MYFRCKKLLTHEHTHIMTIIICVCKNIHVESKVWIFNFILHMHNYDVQVQKVFISNVPSCRSQYRRRESISRLVKKHSTELRIGGL